MPPPNQGRHTRLSDMAQTQEKANRLEHGNTYRFDWAHGDNPAAPKGRESFHAVFLADWGGRYKLKPVDGGEEFFVDGFNYNRTLLEDEEAAP